MKSTFKLLLLLMTLSFIACDKNEDDFSKKDSYLYVWNIRTWNVGTESKLSDIKVTYFFKGDTTRIQNINFWVIKEKSTLYAEEAMKHTDRAFQVTYPQKDPNQKEFKNQCSFRFSEGFRLVVKAIATDNKVVDSPTTESGVFEIYDPNSPEE